MRAAPCADQRPRPFPNATRARSSRSGWWSRATLFRPVQDGFQQGADGARGPEPGLRGVRGAAGTVGEDAAGRAAGEPTSSSPPPSARRARRASAGHAAVRSRAHPGCRPPRTPARRSAATRSALTDGRARSTTSSRGHHLGEGPEVVHEDDVLLGREHGSTGARESGSSGDGAGGDSGGIGDLLDGRGVVSPLADRTVGRLADRGPGLDLLPPAQAGRRVPAGPVPGPMPWRRPDADADGESEVGVRVRAAFVGRCRPLPGSGPRW